VESGKWKVESGKWKVESGTSKKRARAVAAEQRRLSTYFSTFDFSTFHFSSSR
jgi:hypothetical protein